MEIDQEGTILSHHCSCPFDWSEFCEHEIAMLYYLKEKRKKEVRRVNVGEIVEELKQKEEGIKTKI
jgi:uncharacterized Zn finger protein